MIVPYTVRQLLAEKPASGVSFLAYRVDCRNS